MKKYLKIIIPIIILVTGVTLFIAYKHYNKVMIDNSTTKIDSTPIIDTDTSPINEVPDVEEGKIIKIEEKKEETKNNTTSNSNTSKSTNNNTNTNNTKTTTKNETKVEENKTEESTTPVVDTGLEQYLKTHTIETMEQCIVLADKYAEAIANEGHTMCQPDSYKDLSGKKHIRYEIVLFYDDGRKEYKYS